MQLHIPVQLVSLILFLDKLLTLHALPVQRESSALTQQWTQLLETVTLVTIALEDRY